MADADQSNLTTLTVDLLSAYVANNNVQHGDLPELIKSTHAALTTINSPEPPAPEEPDYKPAVSVRKSLGSDQHIISMIDGKPYQTLKRHLSKHNLSPDQYRERYGLPKTYPMIAKAYSEARRAIAAKIGLGRRAGNAQVEAEPSVESKSAETPAAVEAAPAAAKPAAAKAPKPAAAKVKAAPAKAPRKTKAAEAPAAAVDAPTAATPEKPAPEARKAAVPKQNAKPAAAAEDPVKPAARKRATKAAAPVA